MFENVFSAADFVTLVYSCSHSRVLNILYWLRFIPTRHFVCKTGWWETLSLC